MDYSITLPAFIAGFLTFLAPCTLPLVPAYLSFISGVSRTDLQNKERRGAAKRKVIINGFLYVLGFSIVFVLMGTLFGLGGAALASQRVWLTRIGGVFIIIFGLYLLHVLKIPALQFLNDERRFNAGKYLKPGKPLSSFVFGATFAFGWSPCVGPILGSILLLASSAQTMYQGALLLAIFSAGLGLPFILIAFGIGHATEYVKALSRYMNYVSVFGGAFLVFLGTLMLTDNLSMWLGFANKALNFINYDIILNYL